jgi:hypothetical protein
LYHGFLCATDGTCTTIDSPGAGTEANLGTFGEDINSAGTIAGYYSDANNVYRGFVRIPDGAITTFDDPDAGTASGHGTIVTFEEGMNPKGAIIGWYIDSSGVSHGYLRSPDGSTFTTIDGPGAVLTILGGINPARAITGYFADPNGVGHGLLFVDGKVTQLDDPKAGTGNNQSVRYFSARSGSVPGYDDGEGLKLELPLAQSAFSPLLAAAWLKIAVSIAPAAAMRSSLTLWL